MPKKNRTTRRDATRKVAPHHDRAMVHIGGVSSNVRDVIREDIVKLIELWPKESRGTESLTEAMKVLQNILDSPPISITGCHFCGGYVHCKKCCK